MPKGVFIRRSLAIKGWRGGAIARFPLQQVRIRSKCPLLGVMQGNCPENLGLFKIESRSSSRAAKAALAPYRQTIFPRGS